MGVAWHGLTDIQQFLSSAPGTVRPTASGSARGSRSAKRLNQAVRLSCNEKTSLPEDYSYLGYDATLTGNLLMFCKSVLPSFHGSPQKVAWKNRLLIYRNRRSGTSCGKPKGRGVVGKVELWEWIPFIPVVRILKTVLSHITEIHFEFFPLSNIYSHLHRFKGFFRYM
jgi:hypothetical protein